MRWCSFYTAPQGLVNPERPVDIGEKKVAADRYSPFF